MPTTNPIPSTDPTDLLFNAGKLDEVVNGASASYTDRLGVSRRSLAGIDAAADNVLNSIGYSVPVAYASGISLTLTSQTVDYNGVVYAPKSSALPFTTSLWGVDSAKFRAVQVTDADLITYNPAGTGAVATTVRAKLLESVSVKDFGAVGDGVTDDTAAIQAAFTFASSSVFSQPPVGGLSASNGNTNLGVCPRIVFPKGVYLVSSTINHNGAYADVDGGESVIRVASGFSSSAVVFNFAYAWQLHVQGFRFYNAPNAFKMVNANLAMGHLKISNVHMQGGDTFLKLYARSSNTVVSDCRFDAVKHPLIIPGDAGTSSGADVVKFVDCWMVPGILSTAYDGFFRIENNTYYPKLILQNVFYAPAEQTANDVVVVKVEGAATVDVDGCLFGGEAGQVPLIGWHATNGATGTGRGGVVRIKDSSIFMSPSGSATTMPNGYRPVVELYAIPNAVSFENIVGTSNNTSQGYINFRTDFRTFADAIAINSDCIIDFIGRIGNQPYYLTKGAAQNLVRFVRTPARKYRGYLTNLNNSTTPSAGAQIVLPYDEKQRSKKFKLFVHLDNGDIETYSEYLLGTDYNGNWTQLKAIIEGTASTAPMAFLDTNNLYLRANTATSAQWNYWYTIEQIGGLWQGLT